MIPRYIEMYFNAIFFYVDCMVFFKTVSGGTIKIYYQKKIGHKILFQKIDICNSLYWYIHKISIYLQNNKKHYIIEYVLL